MKFLIIFVITIGYHYTSSQTIQSCDSLVYCQGDLLDKIQKAKLLSDSKTFVDRAQKNYPNVTLENFQNFLIDTNNKPTRAQLLNFVNENFETQDEIVSWSPNDWKENPDFLNKIDDKDIRKFAEILHNLWQTLAKKVNDTVFKEPEKHSLIPIPNGFIIPGGRFRESYYWDTYWIIKGLLISEMTETVRGILENYISLIERFGFIPNGNRVYYLNRSQPPLFSLMVGLYIEATNDTAWLEKHIDVIEKELLWWLSNRTITLQINEKSYRFAQYSSPSGTPRPESYLEDYLTCKEFKNDELIRCYKDIKSGAESGHDFSTRWFIGANGSFSEDISMIKTTRIIPVDLNAFLCRAFGELSRFFNIIGNSCKAQKWADLYNTWVQSIQDVLYHELDHIWYDWDIELAKHREGFYPSNFVPLWAKTFDETRAKSISEGAVTYYMNTAQDFLGGIPTSFINSGQQWDFPNAWPPLQDIIVTGLINSGSALGLNMGNILAERTLYAYMIGYNNNGEMFEKYDAVNVGEYGGGGEYVVQSGFGWTNGVALSMIKILYMGTPTEVCHQDPARPQHPGSGYSPNPLERRSQSHPEEASKETSSAEATPSCRTATSRGAPGPSRRGPTSSKIIKIL